MPVLYRYVGPRGLAARATTGVPITSIEDTWRWLAAADTPRGAVETIATFVVTEDGTLLVANRRSEHVACAGGLPVRAAGELGLAIEGDRLCVTRISNQSTGYCPEPESWSAVVAALQTVGLEPTTEFDPRCEFRRCVRCGSLNLVKGGIFECDVCEANLPREYNVQPED